MDMDTRDMNSWWKHQHAVMPPGVVWMNHIDHMYIQTTHPAATAMVDDAEYIIVKRRRNPDYYRVDKTVFMEVWQSWSATHDAYGQWVRGFLS